MASQDQLINLLWNNRHRFISYNEICDLTKCSKGNVSIALNRLNKRIGIKIVKQKIDKRIYVKLINITNQAYIP